MDAGLRRLVFERACGQCEYCMMPSDWDPLPFCIDHTIAQQHAGPTIESNLALSCFSCNTHKGRNIAGLDPANGLPTRLFHPRTDIWMAHFDWIGPVLHGRSPIGRATLQVLNINDPVRVEHRRLLMQEGVSPDGSRFDRGNLDNNLVQFGPRKGVVASAAKWCRETRNRSLL